MELEWKGRTLFVDGVYRGYYVHPSNFPSYWGYIFHADRQYHEFIEWSTTEKGVKDAVEKKIGGVKNESDVSPNGLR